MQIPNDYPLDAFPKTVREAILELEETLKAPRSLIATSFLSAMSATAQAQVMVKNPISGEQKPATLFLFVVANSGERKSTVDRLVCAPLHRFDKASELEHAEALRQYKRQHKQWQSVQRELVKRLTNATCENQTTNLLSQQLEEHEKIEPIRPRLRRLLLQDTSERALLDALEGESQSVAIMSDEGEIILRSPLFTKYGSINKAWDGGTLLLNRANGVSISARNPRVTMSVMAQESVLKKFLRNQGEASRGTGFFSRFLITWPESTQGYRFNTDSEASWEHLSKFHELICELLPKLTVDQTTQNTPLHAYELDEDAKEVFIYISNQVEEMIRPNNYLNDINDSASKTGENILRVAALIHHFSKQTGKISRDSIERAKKIVFFHVEEFKRIFSPKYEEPTAIKDCRLLIEYLHRTVWSQGYCVVPKNDVYRKSSLRNYARFNTAIDTLQQQGYIFLGKAPQSKTLLINLNLLVFGFPPPINQIAPQIQPV